MRMRNRKFDITLILGLFINPVVLLVNLTQAILYAFKKTYISNVQTFKRL